MCHSNPFSHDSRKISLKLHIFDWFWSSRDLNFCCFCYWFCPMCEAIGLAGHEPFDRWAMFAPEPLVSCCSLSLWPYVWSDWILSRSCEQLSDMLSQCSEFVCAEFFYAEFVYAEFVYVEFVYVEFVCVLVCVCSEFVCAQFIYALNSSMVLIRACLICPCLTLLFWIRLCLIRFVYPLNSSVLLIRRCLIRLCWIRLCFQIVFALNSSNA